MRRTLTAKYWGLHILTCFVPLCFVAPCGTAQAASLSESVDGDISDMPESPTAWTLDPGANTLVGSAGTSDDYDILAVTVPDGYQLDSLVLDSFENVSVSFIGLQEGETWMTGLGFGVSGLELNGWELFDSFLIGSDLLPGMGSNAESSNPGGGLAPPLPSGTYTVLLQDTSTPFDYGFTFNVAAVPEPSTMLLALAPLGALALRRVRRG